MTETPPTLTAEVAGITFPNPLGLAAGYDKNAQAVTGTLKLGFGFTELGTVTPEPQKGNPRPRVFRLRRDEAVINRLGFNNDGAAKVSERLRRLRENGNLPAPLGVNLGPGHNQITNAAAALGETAAVVAPYADYVTVNLSSPNTAGLREMQSPPRAEAILRAVADGLAAASSPSSAPPVFLKLSSDIGDDDLSGAVSLARAGACRALIIGNTTTTRPAELRETATARETGGLSGRPLFALSTETLARAWLLGEGEVALIGAGGIDGAEAAWQKIRHGASLVQLYTGLLYHGPGLPRRILSGLEERMRRGGHRRLSDVAGEALRR
ncbi:MAG: quinone-dependent dihydroorotate dehydrogenase [Alphaproteobacteria bacterium]|nr:quinone-dependent dihydroorotate dehydrogenase [Alphaproteobacteria bacterium]MDA8009969.1 quinone-dependent dihydroorotate dehydrogenase [Alphaproteobacteria bacterium]